MNISLIIHTASNDDFLSQQGLPSYFAAVTDNLRHQTLSDFELVYVDAWHAENKEAFANCAASLPYRVKHVPIHPEHRYWYDRGCCFISAAKNTGILYADGKLCVSCDDAEFFPNNLLDSYWGHYHKYGQLMHALHKRLKSIGRGESGLPLNPIAGDEYVNDHRWKSVREGLSGHNHGSLLFAGTSFPLADALAINGYNERMDGCKSLEDCEFGMRLALYGSRFVLDPAGYLFILDHPSYAESMDISWDKNVPTEGQTQPMAPRQRRAIDNFIAVENYAMIVIAQTFNQQVANQGELTPRQLEIIRQETLKYRQFDPLDAQHAEMFKIWSGTPTFDLTKQRHALRNSSDWRW